MYIVNAQRPRCSLALDLHILSVGEVSLRALISLHSHRPAQHIGDGAAPARLLNQRVERLLVVPALLRGNLWQVRGMATLALRISEVDVDAMCAHLACELMIH